MCKKVSFFKKFLAVFLASATLCSGNLVCNKTHAASTSADKAIIGLRVATVGLGVLAATIGGVAAIVASVHTKDLSNDILELELEIIDLISDISDLEKDSGKNLSPAQRKELDDKLSNLKMQLIAKNLKLSVLHKEYRDSCRDLYWLEHNSRYAYIHTYFVTHPYISCYTV